MSFRTVVQDTPAEPAESSATESVQAASDWVEGMLATVQELIAVYGLKVLAAIGVFLVVRWLGGLAVRLIRKTLSVRNVDETLSKFLCNILGIVFLVLALTMAAQTAGIPMTSFVAILGAATLAVGFALQDSLGNFAAGVMLILFRPFKVGDFVEAGGSAGVVEDVGVFATTMKTGDNKTIIIPNGGITGGTITNYSTKPIRRIDLVFGIGYDDDIKKAKELLDRILLENKAVMKDPAPTIGVVELADSSVNIACRPWVNSGDYWPTYFELLETVKVEFDKAQISIPFPQRDVHMHQSA